jgi:tetratricopeptide (TPR) repeat protein
MRALVIVMALVATIGGARVALANETSRTKAKEAMAIFIEVDRMPESQRQARLDRLDKGVALAEEAVAADDTDPYAHFALFSTLGKQVDLSGLSWRVLGRLHRVQAEIDRALDLAPSDPDVLVAKGELLRRLPRPLGGDPALGMRLLHRALEIKPDHLMGRLYLAQAMADDGVPEARAEAYQALALAKKSGDPHDLSEAQHLLASLSD